MEKNEFIIKKVKSNGNYTLLKLDGEKEIKLRPFIYVKQDDILEFIPCIDDYKEIYKIFEDKSTKEPKKIKIYPPYEKKELIYLPPHKFEIIIRERINAKDWNKIKELEKYHYRGKGLNKIVGRRTVLIAEIKDIGIIGFGVLSASVAACAPRFKLLNTNFTRQMKEGLINRIVRIPRIVIHPEFRGLGIGTLMAKHLVRYASEYWDINHYTPILVEVIAAMTEYHKFFEKAGFKKIGYTTGYKGRAIIPKYGNGSFSEREFSRYEFMQNQKQKPYLVYPLNEEIRQRIGSNFLRRTSFVFKNPKLKRPIKFEIFSLKYKIRNGFTRRTRIIKEAFGVDSRHAFSPVIEDFSLSIEPGDVVLITGASGSGKSTILKLLTLPKSLLNPILDWKGKFSQIKKEKIEILNAKNFDNSLPIIEQIRKGKDIREAIELLNSVGLTEAFLYIKTPKQLSEGQKYRLAVAKLADSEKPIWIADEFVSTLNPEMAAIVAKGIRKIAYKYGATLITAASHISFFVESLIPNKIVMLSWKNKPKIYSIKASLSIASEEECSIFISNNGQLPLSNLRIGFIKENGEYQIIDNIQYLAPGETINKFIKVEFLKLSNIYALALKTDQNVGEIFYCQ